LNKTQVKKNFSGGENMVDGEFDHLTCKPKLTIKASNGSDYLDLETIMVGSNPILQISQGVKGMKDINAYGFLGTSSDPAKGYGGGAILMGHGLTGSTDPPKISLTDSGSGYDTLYLRKVNGTTPAHFDVGNLTGHGDVNIDKTTPTINLKTSGNMKVRLTFDGTNGVLSTGAGDLVFAGYSNQVRPFSNNTQYLGNSSFKWKEIWAVTTHFGDAVFANGWRLTEDPEDGVLLVRPDGSTAQKWK
jgi:hypothetical protein